MHIQIHVYTCIHVHSSVSSIYPEGPSLTQPHPAPVVFSRFMYIVSFSIGLKYVKSEGLLLVSDVFFPPAIMIPVHDFSDGPNATEKAPCSFHNDIMAVI